MNMPDIVVNQLSNGLTGILNKPLKIKRIEVRNLKEITKETLGIAS